MLVLAATAARGHVLRNYDGYDDGCDDCYAHDYGDDGVHDSLTDNG